MSKGRDLGELKERCVEIDHNAEFEQYKFKLTPADIEKWDTPEDMVNHPPHYNQYPFEVLEAIHTLLGTEGYKAYLLGNELKYRLRAGFKDKDKVQEDIDKALFYNKERKKLDSDTD